VGVMQIRPHDKRPSEASCGIGMERKRPEPVRWLLMVAIVSLFLLMLLFFGTSLKQIELVVDGEATVISTRADTVEELLAERGIEVDEHDRVFAPEGELASGHRVEVVNTRPVRLTDGGQTFLVHAAGETVEEILADAGITLGAWDRTVPDLKARLADGDALKIIRVKKELAEVEREIPFETVTREDKSLPKGKQKVVQEGEPGVLLELVENVYEDGRLVASRVLDSTIKSPGTERIVAVGTKREVAVLSANSPNIETITKNGITFGVKKILNNVTLTIYDSGPESTGKNEDHPLYGITYTGTKVEEGRTIAVDPSVIPLGWWVYIEGVGFRKAEDTGSAIKGNKIDVYYEDADEAPFGKKRGVTVYIIGPDKPKGL